MRWPSPHSQTFATHTPILVYVRMQQPHPPNFNLSQSRATTSMSPLSKRHAQIWCIALLAIWLSMSCTHVCTGYISSIVDRYLLRASFIFLNRVRAYHIVDWQFLFNWQTQVWLDSKAAWGLGNHHTNINRAKAMKDAPISYDDTH